MTSSHETDSLDDALWFAVYGADFGCEDMVAVSEGDWAEHIEVCLTHSETWGDKLLAAEEEENL